MSLDVYLTSPHLIARESSGIFVRKNGQITEISRAEWDERNPSHEPYIVAHANETREVYSANITHNLATMATEACIYEACWRPEEIGITKASQLIEPLRAGIALMKSDRPRFEKLNAENGWGRYTDFLPWLESYLAACESDPDADVSVSR